LKTDRILTVALPLLVKFLLVLWGRRYEGSGGGNAFCGTRAAGGLYTISSLGSEGNDMSQTVVLEVRDMVRSGINEWGIYNGSAVGRRSPKATIEHEHEPIMSCATAHYMNTGQEIQTYY
jgi:hypothetical protein